MEAGDTFESAGTGRHNMTFLWTVLKRTALYDHQEGFMLQVCPFDHPELLNQIARDASKDLEPEIEEKFALAVRALPADHHPLVTSLVELLEQKTAIIQAQTAQKMCSCRKCRTNR